MILRSLFIFLFTCMTFSVSGTVMTFSKKTLHIKNPTNIAATDMHVSHQLPVIDVKDPNSNSSSSVFSASTGDDNDATIRNFASGVLGANQTVDYDVTLKGNVGSLGVGSFIDQVDFTRDVNGVNEIFHSLDYPIGLFGCDADCIKKRKEFKLNVTGFTNQEYFDFSDLSNASYHLFNGDPLLNLQYSLFDFKLWKSLSNANFANNTLDTSRGELLFSTNQLILNPGDVFSMGLGAVIGGEYAMASIGTLVVRDLDSGQSNTFSTRQFHAVSLIPEPDMFATILLGLMLSVAWKVVSLQP